VPELSLSAAVSGSGGKSAYYSYIYRHFPAKKLKKQ
jgi:hypothetical protein